MNRWLQFLFLLLTASALAHVPERKLISQLDDLNQTLAASYRYDPYGNTTYSSGSLAAANVYRFSSKEVHVNSGLYSYGYRFYSPNWQRWLNQDPIGEWGGINLYGFVGNEPMGFVDPLGLEITYYYGQQLLGGLYPAGPVPYLTGETILENLGASAYNAIPLVVNSLDSALNVVGTMVGGLAELAGEVLARLTDSEAGRELGQRGVLAAAAVIGPKGKPCPPGQTLYRGVARGSVHDLQQAAGRAIVPRGGSASPWLHVNEGVTTSPYTSWTTDINVARRFAGENGVIFQVNRNQLPNVTIEASTFSRLPNEREVLIQGTVYNVGRVKAQ